MSDVEDLEFPTNWDLLAEPVDPSGDPPPEAKGQVTARLGASVADFLLLLLGTGSGIAALMLCGLPVGWPLVPFAVAAAALAWGYATFVLLIVRRTWPGALLMGCVLAERPDPVRARRWVLLLLLSALLLGIPATLAGARGPWRRLGTERVRPSGA